MINKGHDHTELTYLKDLFNLIIVRIYSVRQHQKGPLSSTTYQLSDSTQYVVDLGRVLLSASHLSTRVLI